MTPGPALGCAAICLVVAASFGRRRPTAWLSLTLIAAASGAMAAVIALVSGNAWHWRSGFALAGEHVALHLDGLSALFLLLLSIVGAAGAAYARDYWPDRKHRASAPRGRMWWSVLLLTLGAVLVAANGLHFLIAWELFAVSSYFLVTLERGRRVVRAAGWLYLAASHAGTLLLFAFFATWAARTGSWELGPMREHAALAPLFWLALLGFGVKAGMFPLHVWLPSAHANAPSHVSAILSGVAIKAGIYGIARFGGWLPVPDTAGWLVLGVGAVSALLGIAFALGQNDLKRLLAYSSVENIGVILVGLGGALLGVAHGDTAWGRLALAGALFHLLNHGLFKSLLFLGAGSVLHATGTREMSRLGGLWQTMPWTAGMFAVGAAAVAALPPLNGFVGEWLIYLGLLEAATVRDSVAWGTIPAALILAATGALALATFIKAAGTVFLGAARTKAARHAHESGAWMRGPMIALAVACLAIGVAPLGAWAAITRAAAAWLPAPAGTHLAAPLATLGHAHAVLAVLMIGAAGWLWHRVRTRPVRRARTWDCGYAAPSPRMQYTSGAFADIATRWFAWALRPERTTRRPRGIFPAAALHVERVPETTLEKLIAPIARGVLRASTLVRRLQHGRLQFYLVYVAAGLAGLGVLVLLEELR